MSVIKLGFILLISSSSFKISTSQSQGPKQPAEEEVENNGKGRIVMGTAAAVSEFPFVVRIMNYYYDVNGAPRVRHRCGGALITPTIVITAAHCYHAEEQTAGAYNVYIGIISTRNPPNAQSFDIVKWKLHPKYNGGNLRYDIAVFELKTNALTGSGTIPVETIPLPSNGDYPVGRTDCTVMGWGQVDPNDNTILTKFLMKGAAKIISLDECKKNTHSSHVYDGILCSANPPQAFCAGDSGGPLICPDPNKGNELFLMATVSSNKDPCGGPDNPDIYMRLGYKENLDFIKKYIDPKNTNWGPAVTIVDNDNSLGPRTHGSSRVTLLLCTPLIFVISSSLMC